MSELSDDERKMLEANRLQTFRLYHVRTLGVILKLIKEKKIKDAQEYVNSEIYSVKNIKNLEFAKLLDAITLQIQLKKDKDDKNNSSAR